MNRDPRHASGAGGAGGGGSAGGGPSRDAEYYAQLKYASGSDRGDGTTTSGADTPPRAGEVGMQQDGGGGHRGEGASAGNDFDGDGQAAAAAPGAGRGSAAPGGGGTEADDEATEPDGEEDGAEEREKEDAEEEDAHAACALCGLGLEAEAVLGELLQFDLSTPKRREFASVHFLCARWGCGGVGDGICGKVCGEDARGAWPSSGPCAGRQLTTQSSAVTLSCSRLRLPSLTAAVVSALLLHHRRRCSWAPRAYSDADRPGAQHTLMMVPEEVRRARKIRCRQCKKSGAAMGCDVPECNQTFHLTCALLKVLRQWRAGGGGGGGRGELLGGLCAVLIILRLLP